MLSAGKLVGMLTFPFHIGGHEIPIIIPAASVAEALSSWSACTAEHHRDVSSRMRHKADAVQHMCTTNSATSELPAQLHEHPLEQLRQPQQQGCRDALQQALRGIVGVTLPHGHWASGIVVSKCVSASLSSIETATKVHMHTARTAPQMTSNRCYQQMHRRQHA